MQPYDIADVEALIANFRRVGPDALLFLKHIRSIRIFEIDAPGADMRLLYHTRAAPDPAHDAVRYLTLPTFVEGTAQKPVSKQQFFQALRRNAEDKLPRTDMTVDIVRHEEGGAETRERWAIAAAIGGGRAARNGSE